MSINNKISQTEEFASRQLTLEKGLLANQATSSVLAKYGDTTVLAAVTYGSEDTQKDYFPLSVEYQERLYAGGRIKGSRWVKREGRATDAETLSARLIDRSLRPLFPKNFRREVQVVVIVLSVDMVNDPDILGIIAASAALSSSPIPWLGPVGAVRIGLVDDQLVINPENGNRRGSKLDLVVSSTQDLIHMLEAGANQVSEETMFEAIKTAHQANQKIIDHINQFTSQAQVKKITLEKKTVPAETITQIKKKFSEDIRKFISQSASHEGVDIKQIVSSVSENLEDIYKNQSANIVEELVYENFRELVLEEKARPDGRKFDQIRPLSAQVSILPRVHGSALFNRGQTQALTIATLGAPSLSQSLETAEGEDTKRYMHHYNFPPFSTGETGRMGAPSRREIGHGALAERALLPVIPSEEDFPYAIRVVSEILSSNGSTSMASTCGSTLALMDAGVPIKAPVAGISTGLVTSNDYPKNTQDYTLLTDIIGLEDHYGDMDFKVAGTDLGITAIQLDVKIAGLTLDICQKTLLSAKNARNQIMKVILSTIPKNRAQLSEFAPKISTANIPVEKIGELIGPGGKNIRKLMTETDTVIDVNDSGLVFITGTDPDKVTQAQSYISSIGREVQPGEIFEGVVVSMQPFGAFVNVLPGKDGLVHVSQMAEGYVNDPSQVVHEGDVVKVWVIDVDSQGKISLSMLFDSQGNPFKKVSPPRERNQDFSQSGKFARSPRNRNFSDRRR